MSVTALSHALRGRFDVERLLGSGGMASVFLATELRHQRKVAIKVLHPNAAEVLGVERFVREIAIVSQFVHPNIIPLLDSGSAGPTAYFVMPYIEGGSLRTHLRERGKLPVAAAVQMALEVADALAFAHAKGFVHRDIKPENILLEANHAMVCDFGIAKAVDAVTADGLTSSLVIGTPAYMSPEQMDPKRRVDGRSDIYSLGLVLYELLMGSLPERGVPPWGRSGAHSTSERSTRANAVPRAVRVVIERALASNPDDRPASATEFAMELRGALAKSRWYHTRLFRAGLAVAVLAAGGSIVLWNLNRGPHLNARRLVIAPLVNRTDSAGFDQLGPIAADWLIGGLQRTGLVEIVPSETAIDAYRTVTSGRSGPAGRDPIRALAAETGAGIVVTGAYSLRGGRLRLQIQVTDAISGSLLAVPEEVVADGADPIRGIEELRTRLMGWLSLRYDERLKGQLGPGERPPRYEAYQAFSDGMAYYIATDNRAATPKFLEAYAIDSTFTVALLYGSIGLTNLGEYARADSVLRLVAPRRAQLSDYHRAWLDSRVAFVAGRSEEVLSAIRNAAALAPQSKAVYNQAVAAFQTGYLEEAREALGALDPDRGAMRGFLPFWDLMGAVDHAAGAFRAEFRTGQEAKRRFPGRMTALLPGLRAAVARGDFEAVKRDLAEADQMPRDHAGLSLGDVFLEVGEEMLAHASRARATQVLEAALAKTRDLSIASSWIRARIEYLLGRWPEAAAVVDSLIARAPDNVDYRGFSGMIAARRGDSLRAAQIAESLQPDRPPYQFGASFLYRARIASLLGDKDRAVAFLNQAFQQGKEYDLWLHRDVDFESLRSYPPFVALLLPRPSRKE